MPKVYSVRLVVGFTTEQLRVFQTVIQVGAKGANAPFASCQVAAAAGRFAWIT